MSLAEESGIYQRIPARRSTAGPDRPEAGQLLSRVNNVHIAGCLEFPCIRAQASAQISSADFLNCVRTMDQFRSRAMRVVTFGEVMLRLCPEEHLRVRQVLPGRLGLAHSLPYSPLPAMVSHA